MKRIATCAAAFLLIAGLAPSYAAGGPGGGRPATAGARAKGPKTAATKAKGNGHKSTTQAKKGTADATPDAAARSNVPKSEKLQAKLQAKLGDMPLDEAADGFKNQGQFIAAVHAADRLDVDFTEFKTESQARQDLK